MYATISTFKRKSTSTFAPVAFAIAMGFASLAATAQTTAPVAALAKTAAERSAIEKSDPVITNLRAELKKKYPDNPEPLGISATPIAGVYELHLGESMAYVDATGTYFFFNAAFVDLPKQRNMTEDRLNSLLAMDPAKLDKSKAIAVKKGDGKRTLYVFSDPHCPYCKKLEEEVAKLDNVTVYTFFIPRPAAMAVAESIWCNADRAGSWTTYMQTGKEPLPAQCVNPIKATQDFAAEHSIRGTPTLFSVSGKRIAGYMPLEQLNEFIDEKR